MFSPKQESLSSTYRIRPALLIRLLEQFYLIEKKKVMHHKLDPDRCLIFLNSDIEETYSPWLEHANIQGLHPILRLIISWEIPTVILGCGSIYEPGPDSLGGIFGSLQTFNWSNLPTC